MSLVRFKSGHLGRTLRSTTRNPQASPQASSRLDPVSSQPKTTSLVQSLASPACDSFITLRSESSSDSARTVQFYGLLFPESRMNANIFFDHSILMTKNAIHHFQSFSNFLTFDFFMKLFILNQIYNYGEISIFRTHRGRLKTLVRVTVARKVNFFLIFYKTSSAYFDHLGCFISWLRFLFRSLSSNSIPVIIFQVKTILLI